MVVLQPDAPQILLSGTAHFARPAVDFEGPEGVPLFSDLQITCSISHQVEAKKDESWQGTGKHASQGGVGVWNQREGENLELDMRTMSPHIRFSRTPGYWEGGLVGGPQV